MLSNGKCIEVNGVDDEKEFADLFVALGTVGVNDEELKGLFTVLACLLHLGNVTFSAIAEEGEQAARSGAKRALWKIRIHTKPLGFIKNAPRFASLRFASLRFASLRFASLRSARRRTDRLRYELQYVSSRTFRPARFGLGADAQRVVLEAQPERSRESNERQPLPCNRQNRSGRFDQGE